MEHFQQAPMPLPGNILLLTGLPGIGKTTVAKRVISSLPGLRISGFYTQEIRDKGKRLGFELITLHGERFVMAHIESGSECRVGRYGVNVRAIDRAVSMTLADTRQPQLYIIDEIGKMECFSLQFIRLVTRLLDAGKPLVVATIACRGRGFIAEVKRQYGDELWEVTQKNRDTMPWKIKDWIGRNL